MIVNCPWWQKKIINSRNLFKFHQKIYSCWKRTSNNTNHTCPNLDSIYLTDTMDLLFFSRLNDKTVESNSMIFFSLFFFSLKKKYRNHLLKYIKLLVKTEIMFIHFVSSYTVCWKIIMSKNYFLQFIGWKVMLFR